MTVATEPPKPKRRNKRARKRPEHISLTPARALKKYGVSREFYDLLCLIPGYDPYRDAGECKFDRKAARDALDFFSDCLTHVKGKLAGSPLALEGWEAAIVVCLLGWKRPDGTRRYRRALLYIPRKNGKTTIAAGLVLVLFHTDGEPGAEIYSAAADRDQAMLVFQQVDGMTRNEPLMEERSKFYTATKTIVSIDDPTSFYRAISADAKTKHGFNTHACVVDELHAQPNRELVDVLETSTGSRSQPLIVYVTTADYQRESICNEKHDYACKIRDGIIHDPEFLPVIYEASVDDDWTDPAVWAKANPNLGVSLRRDYLAGQCQQAQELPAYENTFKRLHLNIRTESDVRWLQMEQWNACFAVPAGVERQHILSDLHALAELREERMRRFEGRECCGGLDLSTKWDLSAFALIFPRTEEAAEEAEEPQEVPQEETEEQKESRERIARLLMIPYDALLWYWAPRENAIAREKKDGVPYLAWAEAGFIEMTEGNVIDYDTIRARLNALDSRYNIRDTGFDRWNAMQLATQLGEHDGLEVVEFGQGYKSMSEPSKVFEALVRSGRLDHGGNPVLRWNASNATAAVDPAGNVKPDKGKSTGRIDGIVALIMALGRAMLAESEHTPGVFFL